MLCGTCATHFIPLAILSFVQVSRRWRQIINGTLALQYKIELGADGLVDGIQGAGGITAALPERLRALRRRRDAWRRLAFRRCVTVPMPGECQAYELVAGMFVKAMHNDGDSDVYGVGGPLPPAFFGPLPTSRHMRIATLPSAFEESKTVVREDIGVFCRDFAIDPTQDLMVMVEQQDGCVLRCYCFYCMLIMMHGGSIVRLRYA